jgi:C-terminal processing protease CtpA/Prc
MLLPRWTVLFAVLVLISWTFAVAAPDIPEAERFARIGRLWFAAKYFHPDLACEGIDWDKALAEAIPKVRAAVTAGDVAAAAGAMLSVLHDGTTRVVPPPDPKFATTGAWFRANTTDRVLIVTLTPRSPRSVAVIPAQVSALLKPLATADSLLLDLRCSRGAEEACAEVARSIEESDIFRHLITSPVQLPAARSRMYSGYPGVDAVEGYYTAYHTERAPLLRPVQDARDRALVVLANRYSTLPVSALALQAAGRGSIFISGGSEPAITAAASVFEFGDGWKAYLRTAEYIWPDGRGTPASSRTVDDNVALAEGLKQARNPERLPISRAALPAAPTRELTKIAWEPQFPSSAARLQAGFEIWGVFRYFFPYRDLMGEDWDALLVRFLPRLEQARDAQQYHLAVAELIAHVHDSHASVTSVPLANYLGMAPAPVELRLIGGKPVVFHIVSEVPGLEVGDIVLEIDGENASARMARFEPYISASTPQSLANKLVDQILKGLDATNTAVVLEGRSGIKKVSVPRRYEFWAKLRNRRDGEAVHILSGNVGYADLDRVSLPALDEMFGKLRNTRGIIFDMRGYPRGTAREIAARVAVSPGAPVGILRTLLCFGPDACNSGPSVRTGQYWEEPVAAGSKWTYTRKTLMLIDERTVSQAEYLGMFLRAANGTEFVGSPSAGANGDVTAFFVPGGIRIPFTGREVQLPDGGRLQRRGLQPKIFIEPSIAGIRAGRDEVLERALRYITTGK